MRKGGDQLRVSAQVVEAATGNHLWAERYDRKLADIFSVQDEITERVVAAIEPELYAAEFERSRQKLPESLDAWECVIRGLSALSQSTPAGVAEAELLCRHAIAIAPDYAQAHSLLAWALMRSATWSSAIKPVLSEAAAEADTALRLDDRDAWGHLAKGVVLWRNHKLPEGVRAFRHALELNPNFALAHAYLGHVLANSGVPEEAIESAEHALRLSPRDRLVELRVSIATAHAHFTAERYAEAVVWTRRITERFPEHPWGHMLMSATAAMLGDMQTASEALSTTRRIVPSFSLALLTENTSFSRELREPLYEALRRAGTPEA